MLVRNVVKLVLSNLKAQERIMAAQTCTVWGEMVYDSRTRDMIKARRKNQVFCYFFSCVSSAASFSVLFLFKRMFANSY